MPIPAFIPRFAGLGLRAADLLVFLPALLTRLVIGQAFFFAGRGKLQNIEGTTAFFTDLGIPMPELNAAFISRLEYYGGMLLIVGLLTRLVAALLGATMSVALMTADKAAFLDALRGVGDAGLTDVAPVPYGMFLLWLLLVGPGVASLDTALAKLLGIRKEPEPTPA